MQIVPFAFPEDWDTLELYPLNDLHIADPKTDIPLFRKFVKHIAEQPYRRLIYVGDNLNNATKNSVSNVYNDTMSPNEARKWLEQELQPVKNRFLFFVEGNHEGRSKKDVDLSSVEWLSDKFKPYVEYCTSKNFDYYSDSRCALKVSLGKDSKNNRCTYGIVATHGTGGGKKPGGAINNITDYAMMIEGVDVVISAHVHKSLAHRFRPERMDLQNNVMRQVEKLCVIAPAWQDYGGYAARFMLLPGAKGAEPLLFSGKEKKVKAII